MTPVRRSAVAVIALTPVAGVDKITSEQELASALATLAPISKRVAGLPSSLLQQNDPALGLLAYLGVRDGVLMPYANPATSNVLDFRERERFPEIDELVHILCSRGLLHAEFIERLNLCSQCRSARLLVRDQCPACASSRIAGQAILHHFRCACQAPESDFRLADGSLRCPKCRQNLYQIAVDYEVSSGYCQCMTCNEMSIQPQLGFRCLDCDTHGKAEDLAERDLYSYRLTEAGYAVLKSISRSARN